MQNDDAFRTESRDRVARLVAARFGAAPERLVDVPAGLGTRRFFRVFLGAGSRDGAAAKDYAPRTVIARVEREEDPALRPSGIPPEPALEPLRSVLELAGLPVPTCHASEQGIALLEDVGDTSLEVAAQAGLPPDALAARYREACELVTRLQRIPQRAGVPAFTRRLDEALFRYKASQFIEWTLPWARGASPSERETRTVHEAFAFIASSCRTAPPRLAHRDYKAANLHLHARTPGAAPQLVMIDIQGAFLAPPEYDLVCLLRDSHVALPEALVEQLLDEVRPMLPDAPTREVFDRRFTLLTLSRNGKDLSRYLYAARERGDERYLRLLPRAVATLKFAATRAAPWHPTLSRLAEIVDSLPETECAQ